MAKSLSDRNGEGNNNTENKNEESKRKKTERPKKRIWRRRHNEKLNSNYFHLFADGIARYVLRGMRSNCTE